MVLNLSSPFFDFLSGILMSTIQIVTSEKKIASATSNFFFWGGGGNLEVIHLKSCQMLFKNFQ